MTRASLVAVIGSILTLALLVPSPVAHGASAVSAKPGAADPTPVTDLVAANPSATSRVVAVINYENAAGRMLQNKLSSFARGNPDIRIVVRPLSGGGPLSDFLAKAAYAAGRQGKFVVFHDAALAAPIANTWYSLRDSAPVLGLDWQRFQQDFMDPKIAEEVRANAKFAEEQKIANTPAFVAGGQVFAGPWASLDLEQVAAAARNEAGVVAVSSK